MAPVLRFSLPHPTASFRATWSRFVALALFLVVGCQPASSPGGAAKAAGAVWVDACPSSGVAPAIPYVSGQFARVFTPPGARYLNDHALFRGDDGDWHVIGITDESGGDPWGETAFLHASSRSLDGPWSVQPDALTANADLGEAQIWAPFVARIPSSNTFRMYYYRSGPTSYGLSAAETSEQNAIDWTRVPWPAGSPVAAPGGRDPMLLRDGDRWLLYSVGWRMESDGPHGAIVVSESTDLIGWTPLEIVAEDPDPTDASNGNLESPMVVKYCGYYFLFTTKTEGVSNTDYVRTTVLRSASSTDFLDWAPVTELWAHAAEVVEADDGWHISSVGWTFQVGEVNRGLLIAPLGWAIETP